MRARLRHGGSSHLLLDPVPLPLLSQPHSTARPSPNRYDKRYEHRFLSRGVPNCQNSSRRNKRCMLVSTRLGADFSIGCAHPAMQPPISATHPHPNKRPEARYWDSGPKSVTRLSSVGGALAWGRGKPSPAHCLSTARKPPTHYAQRRTHAPRSTASRGAPRRNHLL
jgi:hypothetical protein